MDVKKKCGCNGTYYDRGSMLQNSYSFYRCKKTKIVSTCAKNCVSEAAILKKFSNLQAA